MACDMFDYGTKVRIGISYKKIPALCVIQPAGGLLMQKIFWSYVKNFWNLPRVTNTESQLVYANNFSLIFESYFFTETIKLVSAFLELLWEKRINL